MNILLTDKFHISEAEYLLKILAMAHFSDIPYWNKIHVLLLL